MKLCELTEEELKWLESLEKNPKSEIILSRKHKIRMNRMFRELLNSKTIPYPEVDCIYERIRSKMKILISKLDKKR